MLEQTELSTALQLAIRQAHYKQTNEVFVSEDTYKAFYNDDYLAQVYFQEPGVHRLGNIQIVIKNSVPAGEVEA